MSPVPSFAPESFGRYYLVDRIAVGGMAEVFKAKSFSERGFEKLLVVKRILQHLSGNDEFVEMFIDEAKISVELTHPNIIQIYDFGKFRENYFIAMECVEGKDAKGLLRKLAERRKILPPEFCAYVAHEAARGLDFAHKKANAKGEALGIVHRDITPSNILISYNGDIKIADFGIAKAQISLYNTKDGVLKGKFEYMSPEQATGERVTAKSDIFALGIILHEMLTGRRLFKTESELKTLERIKSGDYPRPSAINPAVPEALDDIVMRALSKNPDDRFADAKEMQQALQSYLYPSSVDVVRESLALFLGELFAEEIAEERARLEEGTKAATAMYESAPELELEEEGEEWKGGAQTQGTATLATARPSRLPWVIAVAAVLGVVLSGGVAAYLYLQEPAAPQVIVQEVAAPAATTGAVQLGLSPADVEFTLTLNGKPAGVAKGSFLFEKVDPGDVILKVEAEGFVAHEEHLSVVAGERLRQPIKMERVPKAVEATPPKEEKPKVEEDKPKKVEAPPKKEKAAPEQPAEPGTINIGVKGWGQVFIDGKDTGRQAPGSFKVPAGAHTVRVVNADAGLDASKSVTVTPGATSRVSF